MRDSSTRCTSEDPDSPTTEGNMKRKLCGTNYPTSICFIVVNEFCERFSYYGMKAVLTLYFLTYLHWDQNLSTAMYHAFSSLCYFTPILGAVIADSWLGKFKTIIYLSILYAIGHVVKSVGAIPSVGSTEVHIALSMIGLILIALGTGGIKPCVAAFGGDQFDEEDVKERQKFFSIFYMSINAGSLLSTIVTPVLRGDVQCFGGDCFALAFGVPAILMILSTVVFIAGSGMYKRTPPQGNVLLEVCKCIGFAIKNRFRKSKKESKKEHWLDWAEDKYPKRLIQEIKMVLRVLVLYIPLPMFWALFDQQGSRWTLQATRMNLAFGNSFNVKPDQLQMLNALLILIFVPIFELVIYPIVGRCIKITPLRKMAIGMIFAALAFVAATLVEVNVVKTVVEPAPAGNSLLQVYNLAGGDINVNVSTDNPFTAPIKYLEDPAKYEIVNLGESSKNLSIEVMFDGVATQCTELFHETKAYSLIVESSGASEVLCELVEDYTRKADTGNPYLRFLNKGPDMINVSLDDVAFSVPSGIMSLNQTVSRNIYSTVKCAIESKTCSDLDLGLLDFGAFYTFILKEVEGIIVPYKMQDVQANDIHVSFQIPQYVLLTMGEVMYSITGLEFSYSQSPANMKSVLQAGWLLTIAFGNVIVLIVAEGAGLEQWVEFLLFAALLLGVCIIFSIMTLFYTYVDPDDLAKLYQDDSGKDSDPDDDDVKKKGDEIQMNKTPKSTKL